MYGAYLRGAGAFLVGGIVASILSETWSHLRPVVVAGYPNSSAANDSMVVSSFDAINNWFLLMVLIAIIVTIIWNAVIESTLGGRP
jgi:hypothetical protein